jgi:hypothetical protein
VRRAALALSLVAALAPVASAQVGHRPDRSPYRDLEYRMEASLFSGYYSAGSEPAGVAPGSGPLIGARYDVRLGGPAWFTVRLAGTLSERTVVNPRRPVSSRDLGSRSWPVYLADVGLALNLTGFKSYKRLVPVLSAGLGVASDLRSGADTAGFEFGTPFALSFGAGVKWLPGGRTQVRLDITDHTYEIEYPDTFYRAYDGQAPVLRTTVPKNHWTHNIGISLGVSYLFFR